MKARKKTTRPKLPTQQALLGAVVRNKGSGAVVADELDCSQQSVSEWMRGSWVPRRKMQEKMGKLYGIPVPWPTKGAQ
jgi:transcriptional regulator with XRE-family HTH domain